jgi:hypothetical protein
VASELPRKRSTILVRLMAAGPLLPSAIEERGEHDRGGAHPERRDRDRGGTGAALPRERRLGVRSCEWRLGDKRRDRDRPGSHRCEQRLGDQR